VKIWLFALLQSLIGVVGLAAWFYGDNAWVAGIAAGSAALLGVAQPLIGAWKQRKLDAWNDRQHQKALAVIDTHVEDALEIPPPMPHRPTVAVFLNMAAEGDADEQLERYDALVDDIRNADDDCPSEAAAFCAELSGNALGVTLEGLAALTTGQLDNARQFFKEATQLHTAWALPWLGWATVCHLQQDLEELTAKHPQINAVELLPYDCGDEELFLELSESDREELGDLFRQTATALGNYYTAAEMAKSRPAYQQSREEMRRVA